MNKGKFTDAMGALVINFYKILMKHNGQMLDDNRIANVNLFMFLQSVFYETVFVKY